MPQRKRIVIADAPLDELQKSPLNIFQMPAFKAGGLLTRHERTYCCRGYQLFELQRTAPIDPAKAAWFVGESIVSDGGVYVLSRVDPNFLLLSALAAVKSPKFAPLAQTLREAEYPWMALLNCDGLDPAHICDANDILGPDQLLFRLSRPKTLAWLKKKALRLAEALSAQRLSAVAGMEGGFVRGFAAPDAGNATQGGSGSTKAGAAGGGGGSKCRRQAVEVMAEYLDESWVTELKEALGLQKAAKKNNLTGAKRAGAKAGAATRESAESKPKRSWQAADEVDTAMQYVLGSAKRAKSDKAAASSQPLTVGQRKLKKTNIKGMKSMFSFFKKKS